MTGTRLNCPAENADSTVSGSTTPSTLGTIVDAVWAARIVETDRPRRQAAVWSEQPARAANAVPEASADTSDGWVSEYAPLSTIALWKRPAASGEASSECTLSPPAD